MQVFLTITIFLYALLAKQVSAVDKPSWWDIQSIDTMKYSRDLAREKLKSASFEETIDAQVKNIAEAGATHVAIATPYDEEFFPFLEKWVNSARKYELKVWFRGNFSGWEGWFDYPKISREEHIGKTVEFIKTHNEIFLDGDIFSGCPECENGGPGDPRYNDNLERHRKFLIDEYVEVKKTFTNLGLKVSANFNPMNADVAKLVMDAKTTKALGGLVVIDHYVKKPEDLSKDIDIIAAISSGKVFLGEVGAPIPDIHGDMTENEQAEWLDSTMKTLSANKHLTGLNYWVNIGGSTQLWKNDNTPRKAVEVVKKYFSPYISTGQVLNEIGQAIAGAGISNDNFATTSDSDGNFQVKHIEDSELFNISADGYKENAFISRNDNTNRTIILIKEKESLIFKIRKIIYRIFN